MDQNNPYTKNFYEGRHDYTVYAAKTICSLVMKKIPSINSAVDIGCGVGTWLSVLKGQGVSVIQGIEGDWMDTSLLVIPKDKFVQMDLTKPRSLAGRFDLAICLEVAEHLPKDCAKDFIAYLTGLSDVVLFSAAIPLQGGNNHLNEAWQSYWAGVFAEHDYRPCDFIRSQIWDDPKIPFWYRQNIILFVKANLLENFQFDKAQQLPLDLVHPELFVLRCSHTESLSFVQRCARAAKKILRGSV